MYQNIDRIMDQDLAYIQSELVLVESLMDRAPDTAGHIEDVMSKLMETEQSMQA